MWTHFFGVILSWLAIPVFPLLLLAAMMFAEVLLDRTLRFFQPQRNRNGNSPRMSTNGLT